MDTGLQLIVDEIQQELSENDDTKDIMDMIDNYKCDSNFENKTTDDIIMDVIQTLSEYDVPDIDKVSSKLNGYSFIDEICDIQKGRHVRWIRITPDSKRTLTNGGVIVDTKFTNNGLQILCKNKLNRFMQYKFDECISFQRMSKQEQIITMANSSIESSSV
tara:strand:- start:1820 stop:2302 length:483 start_codon:yes stop_codon:yes gene_type:complete